MSLMSWLRHRRRPQQAVVTPSPAAQRAADDFDTRIQVYRQAHQAAPYTELDRGTMRDLTTGKSVMVLNPRFSVLLPFVIGKATHIHLVDTGLYDKSPQVVSGSSDLYTRMRIVHPHAAVFVWPNDWAITLLTWPARPVDIVLLAGGDRHGDLMGQLEYASKITTCMIVAEMSDDQIYKTLADFTARYPWRCTLYDHVWVLTLRANQGHDVAREAM